MSEKMHRFKIKEKGGVRWWLYLWRWVLSCEFYWRSDYTHWTLGFSLGGSEECGIRIRAGMGHVYLTAKAAHPMFQWVLPSWKSRDFSVSAHNGRIWVAIARDDMAGWSTRRGASLRRCWQLLKEEGINWSFSPVDILAGKPVYAEGVKVTTNEQIVLPEGAYDVTVGIGVDTWTRPRWPWPLRIQRARIEALPNKYGGCLPKPGKGENSWDCGQDGLYSSYGPAASVVDALEGVREGVMRDRERYGTGIRWRPEPVETAACEERPEGCEGER